MQEPPNTRNLPTQETSRHINKEELQRLKILTSSIEEKKN